MLIDQLKDVLTKALTQGNSQAASWSPPIILGADPRTAYADGMVRTDDGNSISPQRLLLLPYCEGAAGQGFSMRLFGWRQLKEPDNINPGTSTVTPGATVASLGVWIPTLLAEFACTSCNQGGPVNASGQVSLIQPNENFCDTITLTQGALGLTGLINSTGPGTDLIAFAVVELLGAQRWSWDFQRGDAVNMNCAYARC